MFFGKGLYTCTRATKAAITQANNNMITCFQITIIGVNNHSFLEWTFMPLLIKAHCELLYCSSTLPLNSWCCMIFRRDIVCCFWVSRLKQLPVRVKTKGCFEP